MTSKEIETFYKSIVGLTSKTMRLEARCDALEVACRVLAREPGIPDEKILKLIADVTEAGFQKRLETIESLDAATAASLDYRPAMPDLPTEFL
jgi:hypothetical protein